jgi:LPS-assembly lipoprotein
MSRDASSISSSSPAPRRRALLGAAGLLGLGGCGFSPLYAPGGGGGEELRAEMAAIRIGPVYERNGQLLRRSLQRRFEDSRPGTQARYLLSVTPTFGYEVLGYQRDGTISRVRVTATGNWNLATLAVPPQVLANSPIPYRSFDSFNIPDLQFFSADTAREAAEQRLVELLSEEISRAVVLELRRRNEARTA